VFVCGLLSACGPCGPNQTSTVLLYKSTSIPFINGDPYYFSSALDTVVCPANKLGIRITVFDSTISSVRHPGNKCFDKKFRQEVQTQNLPLGINVFSNKVFLDKSAGESLNDYFLCSNSETDFPQALTDSNFLKLRYSSFVLLLKPDIGVSTATRLRFITELKLSDRTLIDTTKTILFQ
jgi:hypothetical protein